MPTRTVQSPAGERIEVVPDDEFAAVAGTTPTAIKHMHRTRKAILRSLWHDGAVVDPAGFAIAQLADRIGLEQQQRKSVSMKFNEAPMGVAVEREIRGRRTNAVRLVALPETWLARIEAIPESADANIDDDPDGIGVLALDGETQTFGAPIPVDPDTFEPVDVALAAEARASVALDGDTQSGEVEATVHELPVADGGTVHTPDELADQIAGALWIRLVDSVAGTRIDAAELAALRTERDHLLGRLATQTEYADRLRRDLREAQDLNAAHAVTITGLRAHVRDLERTNHALTHAPDVQRLVDEGVRKQLDRIMRQAPGDARARQAAAG